MVAIEKIEHLEDELLKIPNVELAASHHFIDGVYVRCMYLPAGCVGTGRTHKTEHLIVCTKGKVILTTQSGQYDFDAGTVIKVPPNTKKAFYGVEDSILMNIHTNKENLEDVEKLEEELVYPVGYHLMIEGG